MASNPDSNDLDPAMLMVVKMQMDATAIIIEAARELERFTDRDMIERLAQIGLPPMMAIPLFQQTLSTLLSSEVTRDEIGVYTYKAVTKPTIADHMQSFRDMLQPKTS